MRPQLPEGFVYAFCLRNPGDMVYLHRDGRGFWLRGRGNIHEFFRTKRALLAGMRHTDHKRSLVSYTRLTDVIFQPFAYKTEGGDGVT